ncbi:hypothetical protein CG91_gp086 [Mycobacterium phage 39HC]|uniref:hypothetical protein n=1 Tax=Mycobacterium phage 39HC TaxID=1463809 RepID=UPI0003F1EEDD|nr:hypothetical protein CG91_gp086 [Mycobacterium phage 39HC]AHJ88386.1 hypothetical protein 39HC_086 [Mycobacterium phage 39HC]AHJ88486.1 hypothetical protein 40BC_086 [Mycobacterium phage 40BC]
MGLLPKIDLDVAATVKDFLAALHSIDRKLDILIDLQRQALPTPTCGACDQIGRLHCPEHGQAGFIDQRNDWTRGRSAPLPYPDLTEGGTR